MAHTEIIVRVIHDRTIFEENDYARIKMKPSDPKRPDLASEYIGFILDIQNGVILFDCDGIKFNLWVDEIDKMRHANPKENFINTPNFEDTYKEE